MSKTIPFQEVEFLGLSLADVGRVFRWNGRIFRGIFPEHEGDIRRLFDSGLIADLVERGIFVQSSISEYHLDGYSIVIEHGLIETVTYPREWSYSMLKSASLTVLHLNRIASGYGYQTKDCHSYNVLFSGTRAVYVDLGSFVPVARNTDRLLSVDHFLRAYYYPLRLWADIGHGVSERLTQRSGYFLKTEDYLKIRWPIFRSRIGSRLAEVKAKLQMVPGSDRIGEGHFRRDIPKWKLGLVRSFKPLLEVGRGSIGRLQAIVEKEERRSSRTMWSHYHDPFDAANLPPRFGQILDRLRGLDVSSLLEFGGNQGLLCRAVKHLRPELRVVCTDVDEFSIDKGFRSSRSEGHPVNWAVLNPFFAESNICEDGSIPRFRSDVVVALALTHHLVLSQGLHLGRVLDVMSEYANKYLFVEFMPMGLHDGNSVNPVPQWYTTEWFQAEFEARFDLVEKVQLEKNRVLFIGAKRASTSPGQKPQTTGQE